MRLLVINSGSSSIKFALLEINAPGAQEERVLLSGLLEHLGEAEQGRLHLRRHDESGALSETEHAVSLPDHAAGYEELGRLLEASAEWHRDTVIAHRIVHGGTRYSAPVRLDAEVLAGLRDTVALAPLHNPVALQGIEAMAARFPGLTQVGVFDTGFFFDLPDVARHYALPRHLHDQHRVQRFGFHGLSHGFVTERIAEVAGSPRDRPLRLVSLHLGNGASAAAVLGDRCLDTSMGMTPLEGLVMGSRSGDVDAGIIFYLARELALTLEQVENLLNRDSGLKGLCGDSDLRVIHRRADAGDAEAQFALKLYCYRIGKYVGAYHVALGGLDCLVFTGGVGENDARVRAAVCEHLSVLGVELDGERNVESVSALRQISTPDSQVRVMVVPANEELAIARQALTALTR